MFRQAELQSLLDVTHQAAFALGHRRHGDGDQLLGLEVQSGLGEVGLFVKPLVDVAKTRLDHAHRAGSRFSLRGLIFGHTGIFSPQNWKTRGPSQDTARPLPSLWANENCSLAAGTTLAPAVKVLALRAEVVSRKY